MKINFRLQKHHIILIAIILVGVLLRSYQLQERFMYSHDHDLASWMVKDVIVNKHPRLIGQLTSTPGIFIGPLFYYSLVPFYLLFGMDPIGAAVYSVFFGIFAIWSTYFVFKKIFNQRVGLITAYIYSVSFYTVLNDRESVPTAPVIIWTFWYFFALDLVLKKKYDYAFLVLGILMGLIWHINFALVLLALLIPIAIYLSRELPKPKQYLKGIAAFFLTSIPLILFELRHNFSQVRSFIDAFLAEQGDVVYQGIEKFERVAYLASKNAANFVTGQVYATPFLYVLPIAIIALYVYLITRKILKRKHAILIASWLLIYISFFSLYSKTVSEYYLNGMIVLVIISLGLFIDNLLSKKRLKWIAYTLILLFAFVNVYRLFNFKHSRNGYIQRQAIAKEINKHSDSMGYSCVAVSYITDPGYDLGYRYFFWLEGLKLNHISDHVPVYSVVFPQKSYFETDIDFGAIGLIYPDPSIKDSIICEDEDTNVSDSMFGYTE